LLALTATVLLVGNVTPATAEVQVSGKLPNGFVFTEQSSPYRVSSTLLVDEGSTVFIQPGVTIYLPKNDPLFWSLGSIELNGTAEKKIRLIGSKGGFLKSRSAKTPSSLVAAHVLFDNVGSVFSENPSSNDVLDVRITDSEFHSSVIDSWYPNSFTLEKNVFLKGSWVSLGFYVKDWIPGSTSASISRNLFIGNPGVGLWVNVWASYGAPVKVQGNTFKNLNTNALVASVDGVINASGNYWGTTNSAQIQGYVLDKADSFDWKYFMDVSNPLSAPDPLAPTTSVLEAEKLIEAAKKATMPMNLSKFRANSSSLSSTQRAQLNKLAENLTDRNTAVCSTTFTQQNNRSLALRQSRSACNFLKANASMGLKIQATASKTSIRGLNLVTKVSVR